MNKHTTGRRIGFTLVELMVVAIIVAILASVAIPLMSGNKKRAIGTEAEAALGTLRSQLRVMYAETGDYTKKPGLAAGTLTTGIGGSVTNIPGVSASDLQGRYWDASCYKIEALDANTYTLTATGTGEVANVTIKLNDAGVFTRTGM